MERKPIGSLLKFFVYFLLFLPFFNCGSLEAQEKGPVFWTRGGNWGNWLKITAYPGLAIRTACGDDSTLKNYLVSSTDWQLRNGYTEPMAVVWRVQFFDDTIGKNKMGGWMLTHLKADEVLDGWNVEGGHCQARNVISVQVKCAVRDRDEAKCYNSDGKPYPPRPDGAFSGDHNPSGSLAGSGGKAKQGGLASRLVGTNWFCKVDTSWSFPLIALADFRVAFLPNSDAVWASIVETGGVVVNHATWKTASSSISLVRDGSLGNPQYDYGGKKVEEYFDQMSLDADPSSQKTWDEGADFMVFTFTGMTKDSLTGWLAVDPSQKDKFLETISNEENRKDVDKKFPVACTPHH